MPRVAARDAGLYVLARLAGVIGVVLMARHADVDAFNYLWRYDGRHYVEIARHGYDFSWTHKPDGGLVNTDIAFFPLFPALTAAVAFVLPVGAPGAALLVAAVAGTAAAVAIGVVARETVGPRAAPVSVVLWAAAPHAVVLSMAYSESLFVALAAWCLLFVLRGRWLVAGALAAGAGLTRPTGAAVLLALVAAASVEMWRHRRVLLRPALAVAAAVAGLAVHPVWCWVEVGRWDAYLVMQRDGWHSHFDAGAYEWRLLREMLTEQAPNAVAVEGTLTLLVAALLTVVLVLERTRMPLVVYSATLLVLAVGTAGYHQSKPRFLLPAFPLAIALAKMLTGLRTASIAVLLAGLVAVSSWYGGWLLTVAPLSP